MVAALQASRPTTAVANHGRRLFPFMMLSLFLWPKYIGIGLPGFHISPFNISLILLIVFGIADRRTVGSLSHLGKMVFAAFFVWYGGHFISDLMSDDISASAYYDFRDFCFVGIIFLLSVFFYPDDNLNLASDIICWCSIVIFVIVVMECVVGEVFPSLVISHLPQLSLDQSFLDNLTLDKTRDGSFRAQAIFLHPLVLGEVAAGMLPIALARMMNGRQRMVSAVAALCCLLAAYLCGSRSALAAVAVGTLVLFPFMLLLRKTVGAWLMLLAGALPFGLIALVTNIYVSGLIQGRSATEFGSSVMRDIMWDHGWPAFLHKSLFGYGGGNSVYIAGLRATRGNLTIDDYYLSLLLDYGAFGLLGLITFLVLVLACNLFGYGSVQQRRLSAGFLAGICAIMTGQKATSIPEGMAYIMLFAGLLIATQRESGRPVAARAVRTTNRIKS